MVCGVVEKDGRRGLVNHDVVERVRVTDGKLEGDDSASAVGENGGPLLSHGSCYGNYITGRLSWIELLFFLDCAGGHLSSVEGTDGEMLVQVLEDGEELSRESTPTGDHDQQRPGPLVPVVEVTPFILHRRLSSVERHERERRGDGSEMQSSEWYIRGRGMSRDGLEIRRQSRRPSCTYVYPPPSSLKKTI